MFEIQTKIMCVSEEIRWHFLAPLTFLLWALKSAPGVVLSDADTILVRAISHFQRMWARSHPAMAVFPASLWSAAEFKSNILNLAQLSCYEDSQI